MSSNTQHNTDRPFGTNTASTGNTGKLALITMLCLTDILNKIQDFAVQSAMVLSLELILKAWGPGSVTILLPLRTNRGQLQLNMTRLALARKCRSNIMDMAKVLAWATISLTKRASFIVLYSKFSIYLCYTGSNYVGQQHTGNFPPPPLSLFL